MATLTRRARWKAHGPGLAAALAVIATATGSDAKTFKELFPDRTFKNEKAQQLVDGLDFKQGQVALGAGGVQLDVPGKFYFLGPADAQKIIVDVWGNPPDAGKSILGMIMPADKTPLDDGWGAIITFEDDGYVSDEDALKIDYNELLANMKSSTEESSAERVKNGFGSIKLVGWASQPFYDRATNKLHWAKELEFDGKPEHTLNYDVRALGRHGVLKMNFVAGMDDLGAIKAVIPAVMAMPEFEVGSRYQDYKPGIDKVAAYGLSGLIAGKLLAKVGFLAVALAFLKKGWIIVFLLAGGAWNFVKRLFVRQPKQPPQGPPVGPPAA